MDRRARLGGTWSQLRENGFRSISWRARHDSTGFSRPSSQLVDIKPRFLSRRSMLSTYRKENPAKTFPLVPQLDLRVNQRAKHRDLHEKRSPTHILRRPLADLSPFQGDQGGVAPGGSSKVSIRRTASCSGERSSLLLQKRESDAYERTDPGDRPLLRRA